MELGFKCTQLISLTATPAIAEAVNAVSTGRGNNAFQVGRHGGMLVNEVQICSLSVRRGSQRLGYHAVDGPLTAQLK